MSKPLMSKEHVAMFERLLTAQRERLVGEVGKTVEEMGDSPREFADPADRAAFESDSSRDLRIRDRERKLTDKIEEALERIKDGTFGECEECGEMISIGRLRARPVTTLCIECKAEQERDESKPNYRSA